MKVVIIGGSAFSTPSLLALLHSTKRPRPNPSMQIVLASRSTRKLQAVSRAGRVLTGEDLQISTQCMQANWGRTLHGADAVLIQIRVGGLEGRWFDETFPNKYGLCGDEGLGVGGISAAWRTWPVLLPILETVATFCPSAFVILLTSPLSLLVRAALQHLNLNLVGICELPWTTLQALSRRLRLSGEELHADYLGLNHIGWFFNARSGSRDIISELARGNSSFPTAELVQRLGCFPTRYLRMHYETVAVLSEQISQKSPRASVLMDLQEQSYRVFEIGGRDEILAALSQRSTPWYCDAVAPLLLALRGDKVGLDFFLCARNGDYVQFLAVDDIIECRYRWCEGQLTRVPLNNPPPSHVVDVLTDFVRFEQIATKAIVSRSVPLLHEALSCHPWTQKSAQLDGIVQEIVSNRVARPARS